MALASPGGIALASLVVYGQSYLVAGGRDDGISLLPLLPWLDSFDLGGLNLIRYYQLQGRAWKHVFHPAHIAFSQSDFRRGPASDGLARVCRSQSAEILQQELIDRHWLHGFEGPKCLLQDHPALPLG